MAKEINENQLLTDRFNARWVALKYLENDEQIRSLGQDKNKALAEKLEALVEKLSRHLQETLDTYPEVEIADHRYGYIASLIRQGVISVEKSQDRLFLSDKIDKVLTNRFVGPLIMVRLFWVLPYCFGP
jgi:ferrous iron transport protein B